MTKNNLNNEIPPEQLGYASILQILANVALVAMVVGYILYLVGIPEARVPLVEITSLWHLRAAELITQTNMPVGWDILNHLNHGDVLSLMTIGFISTITIVCYIRLIPCFARKKDKPYLILAIVQIVVLIAAACGFLSAGMH